MQGDKKIFLNIFAILAIFADAITVWQFASSGNIFDSWTFSWIISVVLSIGLIGVSAWLISAANSKNTSNKILSGIGFIYVLSCVIMYIAMTHRQFIIGMYFGDYIGYLIICIITAIAGIVIVSNAKTVPLRWCSYLFFFSNFYPIGLTIQKYVFEKNDFALWPFLGEVIATLLMLIAAVMLLEGDSSTQN
jgi:hypothetical protein